MIKNITRQNDEISKAFRKKHRRINRRGVIVRHKYGKTKKIPIYRTITTKAVTNNNFYKDQLEKYKSQRIQKLIKLRQERQQEKARQLLDRVIGNKGGCD